jgi:glycerophosphoryl diester phosphodiesterase
LLDLDYYWYTRIFNPSISKAIAKAKMHHLDGLNVWAGIMLDKSMIHKVHDAGLLLYCWTVDDMEHAGKLSNWGIDAITTNRAAWMKENFH